MAGETDLTTLVAEVAAAYFSNTHVSTSEIHTVISQIATSLNGVGGSATPPAEAPVGQAASETPRRATAAQVRKSITDDGLISFEDGKSYKTLKRHLSIRGLTPAAYREKWGLPADYPMTSPSYSAQRSALAKTLGLGQKVQARRGGRKAKG